MGTLYTSTSGGIGSYTWVKRGSAQWDVVSGMAAYADSSTAVSSTTSSTTTPTTLTSLSHSGGFSLSSSQVVVPLGGLWLVTGYQQVTAEAGTRVVSRVVVSGTASSAVGTAHTGTGTSSITCNGVLRLAAGARLGITLEGSGIRSTYRRLSAVYLAP